MLKPIAVALSLLALPAAAQEIDRTDPNAVAAALLEGFKTRNGPLLAPLMNETNSRMSGALDAMADDDPEWGEMWSSWRQGGIDIYDGTALPARVSSEEPMEVTVPIALDGGEGQLPLDAECSDCRYIVVRMTLDGADDETWGMEDINGQQIGQYEAGRLWEAN